MSKLESHQSERRLTLLLIATATVLAFIGTTEGALMLASLSGIQVSFGLNLSPAHPYLQVFGFLAEFVMGVGYSLIPRFKGKPMPAPFLGYLVYSLLTSGNILLIVAILFQPLVQLGEMLASALFMLAAVVFTAQAARLVTRKGGGFPEADPLMLLSAVSFILAVSVLVLEQTGILASSGIFSPYLIYLGLFGFVGSEIYAVELRSVFIRLCDYRKRFAQALYIFQGLAVAGVFLSDLLGSHLLLAASVSLHLAAVLSFLGATKILERAHPLTSGHEIPPLHRAITRYNETTMLFASAWLFFGCLLGIVWLVFGVNDFYVRDSFIHSIAIGFIASTIVSFAPLLLPPILSNRGPSKSLTLGPAVLLNLGILIRVAGNLQARMQGILPIWESASGPIILVAMVWFLLMIHRLTMRRPVP